ncbi:error-prone DNA polymerase, partial [Thiohalospira sp.]|uniref:error-prone DNA polymerase n=1 Tax=Thiohalospira sp. TaxID=3080549 RepID=UPI003980B223
MSDAPACAELHCLSRFSFLRGASDPAELVATAAERGYTALALTDECSLAGAVRAHEAAREHGLPLIHGSELHLAAGDGLPPLHLVLLAADAGGYANLAGLITTGRRRADKGAYHLTPADVAARAEGCLALWVPPATADPDPAPGHWLAATFPDRAWLAAELHRDGRDDQRRAGLAALQGATGLPITAAGDVHMHRRGRRALQDLVTAIRHNTTLEGARPHLFPNGERHLRPRDDLARLYPAEWLAEGVTIAGRCTFSLDELEYAYPDDDLPADEPPAATLRRAVEAGMAEHWPDGAPERVARQVEHELAVIAELGYEAYFLTVADLVTFARNRGILCQGRGSAANSAICYCLGITAVDPARSALLFERFLSPERGEPPDIDVDFEHQRREEVIQYAFAKYGRERAALAATVITYRPRGALRDTARALGFEPAAVDRLAGALARWDHGLPPPEALREAGFDPEAPGVQRLLTLAGELVGTPRHLSQHVGGMVIAREPLHRLVPVENAAMEGRTVIQWDKDDLAAMGLLKVDLLSLGMLSAIRRAFDLVAGYRGRQLSLAAIPAEDPAVFAMLARGDSLGVFQVESRAQMAMLPRLRPATFYDLVIQVSIVRPGPIQGDMVHPYLRRRQGLEPVEYPGEAVRGVLERTLGVPIFQEQVIELTMVAAGFSAAEADHLRRSMAAWKRGGGLEPFRERLLAGMAANGYAAEWGERIFEQIRGFGEYGFPESHAASFALLVWVSAW